MTKDEDIFGEIDRWDVYFFEDRGRLYEKAIELIKYRHKLRQKYEENTDSMHDDSSNSSECSNLRE
jgi:hypothetical protein